MCFNFLFYLFFSVCGEHQQILSLYCQADKVRCCAMCRISPQHQVHDCDFLHKSNDDDERNTLVAWHLQVKGQLT